MDNKIDELTLTVMEMSSELKTLREDVDQIKGMLTELLERGSSVPITYEKIPLDSPIQADDKIISKALNEFSSPILGDTYLFKKYYLSNKREPPIKKVNGRRIDYWNGTEWVQSDFKGITPIICRNIQRCYVKFNKLDVVGRDAFKNNQNRIMNLMQATAAKELVERILNSV